MPEYATPDDLTDPPEDAAAQIRLASALVDDATLTAFYTVDTEGVPTDEGIRARFKDAVIAQLGYWKKLEIDPVLGDAGVSEEKRVSTKAIGGASISYESRFAQRNMNDRLAALGTLCPEGIAVLGYLAHGRVIVRG